MRRRLALLATPCSGTGFMANALQAAGLRVGHESMGPDGTVCGWAVHGLHQPKFSSFRFDVRGALVRDPRLVLETLPRWADRRMGARRPWTHADPIVAALRWWVMTYELLADADLVVRLHRLDVDWPALLEELELAQIPLPEIERDHKPHRWDRLTFDQLGELDAAYAKRAEEIWGGYA